MRLNEGRTRLSLEDGDLGAVGAGREPSEPALGHLFLPALATAPLSHHRIGTGHADAIEVVTCHAREPACFERVDRETSEVVTGDTREPACCERVDRGGLAGARRADDAEQCWSHRQTSRLGSVMMRSACPSGRGLRRTGVSTGFPRSPANRMTPRVSAGRLRLILAMALKRRRTRGYNDDGTAKDSDFRFPRKALISATTAPRRGARTSSRRQP